MNFVWIPKKSFGNLLFGKSLDSYDSVKPLMNGMHFESIEIYECISHGVRVFYKRGIVHSVECYETCYYKNVNIIGLPMEIALGLLDIDECQFGGGSDKIEFISNTQGITLISENEKITSVKLYS